MRENTAGERRSGVPPEVAEISAKRCGRCGGRATSLVQTRMSGNRVSSRFYCRRCADEVSRLTSPAAMASRRLRQRRHELALL